MNCRSVENLIDLYAEESLSPARMAAIAAHLKGCKDCAALAHLARPLPRAAKVSAPDALKARLKKALSAAEPAESPKLRLIRVERDSVPVLAFAALSGFLSLMLHATLRAPNSQKQAVELGRLP